MSNDYDPSCADLPPKSGILDIEYFMESHRKEIIDFIEKKISEKISEKRVTEIKIPYKITARVINQLTKEMPFGPSRGYIHVLLADALISSLWCGWVSNAMVNRGEPKFNAEYPEQFRRAISKAYDIGRKYASERP
jgi:hypothetical protein